MLTNFFIFSLILTVLTCFGYILISYVFIRSITRYLLRILIVHPWTFFKGENYPGWFSLCKYAIHQCYKYRVGEYIANCPKRNYRIYRQKCRQTSAIYQQNKKYKNIKKYKKRKKSQYIWKNRQISPKIGKYRQKSANIVIKSANIARKSEKTAKKNRENIGAIYCRYIASELTSRYIAMLPIYWRYL